MLKKTISHLLSNPEKLRYLSEVGYNSFKEKYTWNIILQQYKETIDSLLFNVPAK